MGDSLSECQHLSQLIKAVFRLELKKYDLEFSFIYKDHSRRQSKSDSFTTGTRGGNIQARGGACRAAGGGT